MTRTIKASEIKEGMTVQLQVEVDFVREHRDWVTFFRDDGRSVGLDGGIEVEVLSEPQANEPAPGSVIRLMDGTMYCRVNSGDVAWVRVNGRGASWTWEDVLGMTFGAYELVFNPTESGM